MKKLRWIFPLLLLSLVALLLGWLWKEEHAARYLATIALGTLSAVGCLLWFVFTSGASWSKKGGVLLLVIFGAFIFAALTRWDGSSSGTAIPRLIWAWSETKGSTVDDLAFTPSATHSFVEARSNFMGMHQGATIPVREFSTDWETTPPKELWRRPLGLGWGSFAVDRGYAITMEQRGSNEMTTCYDLLSGEPLWAHERATRFSEVMGGDGPRATPTIDGDEVFAMGANGHLDCLSLTNGALHWSVDIIEGTNHLMYGKSCAPLVVDDLVVVSGGQSGPTLLSFDRASGEPRWQVGSGLNSYASPVLGTLHGVRHIITVNGMSASGHEIATGKILWDQPWPQAWPKSGQPICISDSSVLCTASYGAKSMVIDFDEQLVPTQRWMENRLKTKFSSAMAKDGYGYALDEGIFICVDLSDGDKIWKKGRYGFGQNLLVEDTIVLQAEEGDVVLIEPSPDELKEIARIEALSSMTWNTPTIAGRYLLVRNDEEAICYELPARE